MIPTSIYIKVYISLIIVFVSVGCGSEKSNKDSPLPDSIGEIITEDTELSGFIGKSTYASISEVGFILSVYTAPIPKQTFTKKATGYICTKIQEVSIVTILLVGVDKTGFPTISSFENTESNSETKIRFDYNAGNGPVTGYGQIDFEGELPQEIGDEFTLKIDVDFEGDSYKSTIRTSVIEEIDDQPTPPTCDEGQYPAPIYN